MYYIGIDLGGTSVKLGIVDEACRIVKMGSTPTPPNCGAKELVSDMVSLAGKLLEEAGISVEQVASLGLGVPGTANKRTGLMEYANNLCFENEPLTHYLEEYFHKPVYFTNDANAAAWGEFVAGCGKGHSSMIMVTLGTGIGGGIILNGRLYEGCNYAAGEFGHLTLQYDGLPCNCGRRGCFEVYASATALCRLGREAMEAEEGRDSLLWTLSGHNPENVGGDMIFKASESGDATAARVVDRYIKYLSIGVTDLINIFQPEILCIGGGVSNAGEALLVPLKKLVGEKIYTRTSAVKTELVMASLGNRAGIIGAAMLRE